MTDVKFRKGNIWKTPKTEGDKARLRKAGFVEYVNGKPLKIEEGDYKKIIAGKDTEIATLIKENEELKAEIKSLDEELEDLKGQNDADSDKGADVVADSKKK